MNDGEGAARPDGAEPDEGLFGGRYVLGDLLGVGGTASVFAAEDIGASDDSVRATGADVPDAADGVVAPTPRRPVALKILHPHLSADDASRDAFLAEARAAQELRHPNVAAVRGSGVHEAAGVVLAWIALDLVDGGSVGERVDDGGPLPPAQAAAVLDGVLAALTAAHQVRLVHRDVSPANVLLHGVEPHEPLRADHVRLVDFGLADATGRTAVGRDVLGTGADVLRAGPGADGAAVTVVLDAARDGEAPGRTAVSGVSPAGAGEVVRTVVGNPQFMSPEQAQGRPVRVAGDLYQAGALLYYLLTGRPPFPRGTDTQVLDAHVSAPPPVPSALVPGARAFDRVVTRAMHKTPVRRFRDAAEMRAALAAAAATITPGGPAGAEDVESVAGVAAAAGYTGAGTAHDPDGGPAAGAAAGGVGQRRTGDLEYLAPAEPEPADAVPARGGVAGVGLVVGGLLVAALAVWAAAAAPGLPTAGPSPSALASVSSTPAPSASRSPSPSASPDPSPTPSTSESAAPSPSSTPTSSPTDTETAEPSSATEPPSGTERVRVPLLTGSLAEAQAALHDAGLVLGDVTRADSPEPADTVLGQRPVASRTVPEGTEVAVTVASGRNTVPAVAGMTLGAAVAEIEAAGFVVVPEDPNAPPTLPASGTTPGAGAVLRLGVSVTVLVGEPPPTPTPSPSPGGST